MRIYAMIRMVSALMCLEPEMWSYSDFSLFCCFLLEKFPVINGTSAKRENYFEADLKNFNICRGVLIFEFLGQNHA